MAPGRRAWRIGRFLFQRPAVQDTLDAIFTNMISSLRNNVLQNLRRPSAYWDWRALMGEQAAMQEALVAAGLSPEQAKVMAVNSQAAKLRLDMMERQRDMEMQAQQRGQTYDFCSKRARIRGDDLTPACQCKPRMGVKVRQSRGRRERQGNHERWRRHDL